MLRRRLRVDSHHVVLLGGSFGEAVRRADLGDSLRCQLGAYAPGCLIIFPATLSFLNSDSHRPLSCV